MQYKWIWSIVVLCLIFLSSDLYGHPGHGSGSGYEITHYFNSPLHLFALLTVVVILFVYTLRKMGGSWSKKN